MLYSKAKLAYYPGISWLSTFAFQTPIMRRTYFSSVNSTRSCRSSYTWSNRKIWPWNTEWSRAKTNRVLPRKCTGHNKHPLPTAQEKTVHMDITRWSTPKCSTWMQSQKRQNDHCLFPRQLIYAPTNNAEEAEVEWFYEDLQDLLELTPQKMSFSL